MKPRSTVKSLLAVTEQLIAARKAARARQSATAAPRSKVATLLTEARPLFLRLKPQSAA
jgi:hypothetical protein